MTVKVLFFDTSALLKLFVTEEGTSKVQWLVSSRTRMLYSLSFVVNEQVCSEFESKIKSFAETGKLTIKDADRNAHKFFKHYKNKVFRLIGQGIVSNTKQEVTIDAVCKTLDLKVGKNDWDGLIYQSIVNRLAFLGGESHPILVTCDRPLERKVKAQGYRVINPARQNVDEIRALIA